jgi:hypothetical protein
MSFTKLIGKIQKPEDEIPELFQALAKALCEEMVKQGLWLQSPQILGYDWDYWYENRYGNGKGSCMGRRGINIKFKGRNSKLIGSIPSSAFIDLLFDCYVVVIFKQLEYLQGQIELGNTIDGSVLQNLKLFVMDLRRTKDSVGYNVAINAKLGFQHAIDRKIINSDDQDEIDNNTQFTFSECPTTPSDENSISEVLSQTEAWTNTFKLKMSKQMRRRRESEKEFKDSFQREIGDPFCEMLKQLNNSGINCFRFKNMVDAMKEDVRRVVADEQARNMAPDDLDHTAIECPDDDAINEEESVNIIPFIVDEQYEYTAFDERCKNIRNAIAQSDYSEKVRERLRQEFNEIEVSIKEKTAPLQAEIANSLGIAISTLSDDMNRLRHMMVEDDIASFIRPDGRVRSPERCHQLRKAIENSNSPPRLCELLDQVLTEFDTLIGREKKLPLQKKIAKALNMNPEIAPMSGYMNKLCELVKKVERF